MCPAPTNHTPGIAEPLTCAWAGLPPGAPVCRLHRQDLMISKGKIRAIQAGSSWPRAPPGEGQGLRRGVSGGRGRGAGVPHGGGLWAGPRASPPLPAVLVSGSPAKGIGAESSTSHHELSRFPCPPRSMKSRPHFSSVLEKLLCATRGTYGVRYP